MKKIFKIGLLVLSVMSFSCSSYKEQELSGISGSISGLSSSDNGAAAGKPSGYIHMRSPVVGAWSLYETFGQHSDSIYWKATDEQEILKFTSDSIFTSAPQANLSKGGAYTTDGLQHLFLKYGDQIFTVHFQIENGDLILTPAYKTCPTGCSRKYKRL